MPQIQIDDFSWRYTTGDWVLKDISLTVDQGECIGIVGRSGCGKSTLALALNGIIPQSTAGAMKGQVVVCNRNTETTPVSFLARSVGMVFQSPDDQMSQILVCHEISSGPAYLQLSREHIEKTARSAAERLGISHLWNRDTNLLSGGEKQKVAIAAALAMNPEILILDEPTTDLDPASKIEIVEILKRLNNNITLIIISHDIEVLYPLVRRLIVMKDGNIIADDSASNLYKTPDTLTAASVAVPQLSELNRLASLSIRGWIETEDPTKIIGQLNGYRPIAYQQRIVVPTNEIVKIENVTYSYPESKISALDRVSLSIYRGEIFSIIGTNGSGKTTLSKIVTGILKPETGCITVDGLVISTVQPEKFGYIYQNPDCMLFEIDVQSEISFGPKNIGLPNLEELVDRMLNTFELTDLRDRFPLAVSKGQRQKIAYAAVSAAKPPVFIFDEPTTGIDKSGCDKIMQFMDELRKEGHTIIFITHDVDLALRWADRIAIMRQGKIVHVGSPESVMSLGSSSLMDSRIVLSPITMLSAQIGIFQPITTAQEFMEVILQ